MTFKRVGFNRTCRPDTSPDENDSSICLHLATCFLTLAPSRTHIIHIYIIYIHTHTHTHTRHFHSTHSPDSTQKFRSPGRAPWTLRPGSQPTHTRSHSHHLSLILTLDSYFQCTLTKSTHAHTHTDSDTVSHNLSLTNRQTVYTYRNQIHMRIPLFLRDA